MRVFPVVVAVFCYPSIVLVWRLLVEKKGQCFGSLEELGTQRTLTLQACALAGSLSVPRPFARKHPGVLR